MTLIEQPQLPAPDHVEHAREQLGPPDMRERLARLQTALCEPARLKIVQALRAGPLSVNELAAAIGRKPEATSQHLRILRELGAVEGRRRSTRVYYQLSDGSVSAGLREVLNAAERATFGMTSPPKSPTPKDVAHVDKTRP